MTSSAKKKRERKKDFQKPKLKVGKAKPKASNQTDTSFRAKAIVLNQQLAVDAPSAAAQYHHHVSLLSSRSDSQRRDSLAFLTTQYATSGSSATFPLSTGALLDKACTIILDGSTNVRKQLLKLFRVLPRTDVQDHVSKLLPHIRAGMTHLSRDIRLSSVEILSWLVATAGAEAVSCAGAWYQTLECLTAILSWRSADIARWTAPKPSGGDAKSTANIITTLAEFLEAGLIESHSEDILETFASSFPFWHPGHHRLPVRSNAYAYLNLFGLPRDARDQMLEDREDRVKVYNQSFREIINAGILAGKKEGGELGRATGVLSKVLDRAQLDDVFG